MISQLDSLPTFRDASLTPQSCVEKGAAEPELPDGEPTTFALVELLLKKPQMVDRLNGDATRQGELFPRFLVIALTSYLAYASVMVLLLNLAPAAAYPTSAELPLPTTAWSGGSPWSLPLAYAVGIILAACVCLPSFYFYSLLAGVHLTWLQITSVIGKGMAANAILLLGLLPVYVAAALGAIIFAAPTDILQVILGLGLLLPFAAGLWGVRSIYVGLMSLSAALPLEWQCRRRCFLRRLVLSWSAVYTAVVPIMIYRLWEHLS